MPERDAIQWGSIKLKCDANGCDHVELVESINAGLVGKPCPKCGANLLTEEDHSASERMVEVVALINGFIGKVDVPEGIEPSRIAASFNPHAGALNIKIRDVP